MNLNKIPNERTGVLIPAVTPGVQSSDVSAAAAGCLQSKSLILYFAKKINVFLACWRFSGQPDVFILCWPQEILESLEVYLRLSEACYLMTFGGMSKFLHLGSGIGLGRRKLDR